MKSPWSQFLLRWLSTTIAVFVASRLPGVECDRLPPLVLAALVLGLLNALVRPVLLLASVPLMLITLGLGIPIIFVCINALLFWLAGQLVPGFEVRGFWPSVGGGLVVSLVSWVLNKLFGVDSRPAIARPDSPAPAPGHPRHRKGPPDGEGPVIDV